MTSAEQQLFELLKTRSFQRGTFRLASGGTSDYYIDGRLTAVYSEAAYLIGEIIYDRTHELRLGAIGGLAVGAVPLTTAAVIAYHRHGRPMEGFWVRSQAKAHGTQKLVEGALKPGARVAIVEDVITQGNSSLQAIEEVRKLKCEVAVVLALVDRLQGAKKLLADAGIANFRSVFTIRDFGVSVPD